MSILNSLIHDLYDKITIEAGNLVKYAKQTTLTSRDIQTAVRLVLPRELSWHAVTQGTNAIMKM
jgi:histone H2B